MNISKKQTVTQSQRKSGTLSHAQISKLTTLSLLAAVIVVLQIVATALTNKMGAPCISLSLVPIVIGAAFYGKGAGAFLGAVFGMVTFICGATGFDKGCYELFMANPFMYFMACMVKAVVSGFCAGLVYRLVCGRNPSAKRAYVSALLAALTAPIVNTGIFFLFMVLFFHDNLVSMAGDNNIIYFALVGLAGVNFLIETGINLVCSPAINSIVRAVKKSS